MEAAPPLAPSRPVVDVAPPLPRACGPLTETLFRRLRRPPGDLPADPPVGDLEWEADDFQLALYCCYELHYRSFAGVADGWEWEPSLLRWRATLERRFLDLLHDMAGPVPPVRSGADTALALQAAVADASGPSLSSFVERDGTLAHFREFAVHRTAYQLKEADPHMWAAPRLSGRPKAAFLRIQYEEYGSGVASDIHAALFADVLRALDLDAAYGAYLDLLPGVTLATVNLASLFGLHRRWRGALVGHLALFEMTSVTPMARYSRALARLGRPDACRFYDVHVDADAVHEVVAVEEMAASLADGDPRVSGDIVFGARAALAVEERFARHVLGCWDRGTTSLRRPLPVEG